MWKSCLCVRVTLYQRLPIQHGKLSLKVVKQLRFSIVQGCYKRNTQFQHFIQPKLFKISTLTMHDFVEILEVLPLKPMMT
jgi:hypothetical protein